MILTCNALDKLNRDFVWGYTDEKRKLHALKWEIIILPKQKGWGGVSIPITKEKNEVLITYFSWRRETSMAPWAKVLNSRYFNPISTPLNSESCTWNDLK